MKRFLRLDVSGIPFFQKASLDLSHHGLIVLLGANKDGDVGGNAAGKSLLARQLPEIILGTSLSSRRDSSRHGSRAFEVGIGKKQFRIEQSFSPRETIKVYRDGVDLGYHTLDESRSAVSSIMSDMGDPEIRSLLYLDSNRPHPLIKGDSTDRKKFFTQFFKLHGTSAMKKLISEELREMTRAEGSRSELESQLKETPFTDPKQIQKMTVRLDTLKERHARISEQIAKRARVESLCDSWSAAQPVVSKLRKVFDINSLEELEARVSQLMGRASKLKLRMAEFEEYRTALSRYEKDLESLGEFRSGVKNICLDFPEFSGLSWEDLTSWVHEASTKLEAITEADKAHERLTRDVGDLKQRLGDVEDRIKHLSAETDVCPTCGGPHDNVTARTKLVEAKTRKKELIRKLETTESELASIPVVKSKKLEARISAARELRGFVRVLEKSDANGPPTKPRWNEEELKAEYSDVSGDLNLLMSVDRTVFRTREAWRSLPEDLKAMLSTDMPDASGLSEEIATLSDELRSAQHGNEQHLLLKKRLAQVESRLSDREPLELLEQAFSRDGVESLQIRALCARLEAQIQKLAPLLFPEDYRFEFDLTKHFDIIVHRNYRGKNIQSDVRLLSGSETRMFSLLLFMGLTVFIPKNKRLSLLILDEPESAMSPQYLERFMSFLPVLNKVVPTILIVTPQSPDLYSSLNPKFVTVVKKNGRSRLVEGVVQ